MPGYEFVGTVKKIGDVQTFASGFSKRELVVTSEGERFPQDVMFEFLKEKADLLAPLSEADRVKVSFDIGGREYNGRYFKQPQGLEDRKGRRHRPGGPGAGGGLARRPRADAQGRRGRRRQPPVLIPAAGGRRATGAPAP